MSALTHSFRCAILGICAFLAALARIRPVAINAVLTPHETSRGTETMNATSAITFKNALVTKTGTADDRTFEKTALVTDVPYGILLNDEVGSDEYGVISKNVAILGLYPESLPAVAAAAIAVNAQLVADLVTPGRVKTLPTAAGDYWVIGSSRFAVSTAGDPVSIAHCAPYLVRVAGLTDSTGGTPSTTLAAITVTTPADLAAVGTQLGIIRNAIASLAAAIQ